MGVTDVLLIQCQFRLSKNVLMCSKIYLSVFQLLNSRNQPRKYSKIIFQKKLNLLCKRLLKGIPAKGQYLSKVCSIISTILVVIF